MGWIVGRVARLGVRHSDGFSVGGVRGAWRCRVGLGAEVRVGHDGPSAGRVTRLQVLGAEAWFVARITDAAAWQMIAERHPIGVSGGWGAYPWDRDELGIGDIRTLHRAVLLHLALVPPGLAADPACRVAAFSEHRNGPWTELPDPLALGRTA